MLFRVAMPIPAGRQRSQKRSRQARLRENRAGSVGFLARDCPTNIEWSVSSLTMPHPKRNRCLRGSLANLLSRRGEIPSYGRQIESPTAQPSRHPSIAVRRSGMIFSRKFFYGATCPARGMIPVIVGAWRTSYSRPPTIAAFTKLVPPSVCVPWLA